MKKRLCSILLALCMLLTLLPVSALAADAWTGAADTGWYDGHEDDVSYTLATAEELAGLAQLVNGGNSFSGKTIVLGDDLDLAGLAWTPIGASGTPFQGAFDGAGHTVSNLSVNNSQLEYAGLFGLLQSPGSVKDLTLNSASVTGNYKVGGLIGSAFDDNQIAGCTVSGVTVVSNATAEYIAANPASAAIGGIVGLYTGNGSHNGSLTGCTVEDLTLRSDNPGVQMGYLTGGLRGSGKVEELPTSENWSQSGNQIQGSNTGSTTGCVLVGDIFYPTLADAVAAAAPDDTVTLMGSVTLESNLTIDKNLIIRGANAGLAWDDPARGAESAIVTYVDQAVSNEGGRIVIAGGAAVTLDGVAVTGTYAADVAAPIIAMQGTAQLTINNCVVADTGSAHSSGYGLINTMACAAGSKLTITDSRLTGVLGSDEVVSPPTYYTIGGGGVCQLDIQNNRFETGRWVLFNTAASGVFSGNTVVKSDTAPESASSSVINSTVLNNLVISDNIFDESLNGTRFVIGGSYTIAENTFESLGGDLALYICSGPNEGQTVSITGNAFNMTENSYGIRFVDVSWGAGGDLSDFTVQGNTFTAQGVYQIRTDGLESGKWTGLVNALDNQYPAGVKMVGNVAALDLGGGTVADIQAVEIVWDEASSQYLLTLPTPTWDDRHIFQAWSDGVDTYTPRPTWTSRPRPWIRTRAAASPSSPWTSPPWCGWWPPPPGARRTSSWRRATARTPWW